MINVLIIDDEPNIRNGLKVIVPWNEEGFNICGEGIDAEDGLEKIMSLNPDIVLIDIKMRGMLGTDVIRESRERGFKGRFIIISGYSNFEYAKEGIKYGVSSYLLKPIDEDELMDILIELKNEINEEKRLTCSKDRLREVNLEDIILCRKGNKTDYYKKYDSFNLALISIKELNDDEIKSIEYEVKSFLSNYENVETFYIDYIGILFKDFKRCRVKNTLELLLKSIASKYRNKLFITLAKEIYVIEDLANSFREAISIMKNSFLYLDKGVLCAEDIVAKGNGDTISKDQLINKIYSYIEVNNIYVLNEALIDLREFSVENLISESKIKTFGINILFELREKLQKNYELDEKCFLSNEEIIHNICDKDSLSGVMKYLEDVFKKLSQYVSLGSSENNVKRILAYMEKNYYKDLKLESLAKIFNYNSAYLGKLLKSTIGESFNTRLDKIRIENAKSLLVNDKLKVYQVCKQVGYKNIDYFHAKFKKYVGTSPMNYKKQYENNKKI